VSLPQIALTGNVVDDPELRFTGTGKAVVSFRVACNERKKTDAGGWTDGDSLFLGVTAWEQQAEAIAEQVAKGSKVTVVGKLRQRQWEDKDGNKRSTYEVQAFDVALVVRPPKAEREKPQQPAQDPWSTNDAAPPW
jgi:single-strand DNA-binding protein